MVAALFIYVLHINKKENLGLSQTSLKVDFIEIKKALKIGLPAAGQMALEVGIFSLSTVLASHLDVNSLSAHTIVLTIASFTFMVPLGISAAAAILVGYSFGRNDMKTARASGWASFLLGTLFMMFSSIVLYSFGRTILNFFTHDEVVIGLGRRILLLAAFFQVFDGIQTVGTGALRGLGETKIPFISNLVGYWVVGLPLGMILCFNFSFGLTGLWLGLTIGLIIVAVAVLADWIKQTAIKE